MPGSCANLTCTASGQKPIGVHESEQAIRHEHALHTLFLGSTRPVRQPQKGCPKRGRGCATAAKRSLALRPKRLPPTLSAGSTCQTRRAGRCAALIYPTRPQLFDCVADKASACRCEAKSCALEVRTPLQARRQPADAKPRAAQWKSGLRCTQGVSRTCRVDKRSASTSRSCRSRARNEVWALGTLSERARKQLSPEALHCAKALRAFGAYSSAQQRSVSRGQAQSGSWPG